MASAAFVNGLLDEFHDDVNVEVDRRVLHLVLCIHHTDLVEGFRELALLLGLHEFFAHLCVVFYVLADQLVN